jgi:hypothetical protein
MSKSSPLRLGRCLIKQRGVKLAFASFLLAACGTSQMESRAYLQAPTRIDGSWAASDGAYTVTFLDGRFITRRIKTSALLAQGLYEVQGEKVAMRWVSSATGKRLSAICSFTSPSKARCVQGDALRFKLTRLTGSAVGI